MSTARGGRATDGVVEDAPVSRFDVLPRLVVGERRLVVQWRGSMVAGQRPRVLGKRKYRQA
jgi:hypothetical protein